MSQNTALIEYYKNLLIMQSRDKPNAHAHIGALVKEAMIYDTAVSIRDCFDVETAVGAQQDFLGKYLGVSRTVTGTAFTRAYYGYSLYGDTSPFTFNPMIIYGVEPPDVQFRDYKESQQSLYDLTNEEYRIIQKLAIVRNNSNASVKDIDDIIFALFGPECYFIDRMNMTVVSYMVGEKWGRIFQIARSEGLLPNPAGVGTALVVVPDINNIFSYSLYGGGAPTFAVGYWNYFGEWSAVGPGLVVPGVESPSTAALSSSRIALVDPAAGTLQAYDFDGTAWVAVGDSLYLGEVGLSSITALTSTRVALASGSYRTIQAYDFDGTDWVAVGALISFPGSVGIAISSMSSSRVAFIATASFRLYAYDFDGSNWSQTGNGFLLGSLGSVALSSLSSSRVSFMNRDSEELSSYDFDGTDWTLIGNIFPTGAIGIPSISALSSDQVVFVDSANDELRLYDFNGTDWSLEPDAFALGTIGFPALSALSSSRISFIDSSGATLQAYDLLDDTDGCMASYS